MTAISKVRVATLVSDWDMRRIHALRTHFAARKLRNGECIVAFNKKQTMARIVDWKGGVHSYWAGEGGYFDLESLRELVKVAFFVDLHPGAMARAKAAALWAA